MNKLSRKVRGASTVEYALLLVGVLLVAAAAVKGLGGKVSASAKAADTAITAPPAK